MTAGVAFLELPPGSCRWPVGDHDGMSTLFCGAPARAGSSYCDCHHRQAYLAPAKRRAGQLLAEMEKSPGVRMNGRDAFGGAVKEPPKNERTLSDMGISKKQSSNWQRLAKVPAKRQTPREGITPNARQTGRR